MFPQGLWLLWVEENYVIQVFVTVFFFFYLTATMSYKEHKTCME